MQTGTLVFLFQCHHLFKEAHAQQGRLATLPRKHDFVAALAFDVLADVGFENLVAERSLAMAAQQFFLVEVIAISAVEIADRSRRLHHGVEARLRSRIDRQRRFGIDGVAHASAQFSSRTCSPEPFGVLIGLRYYSRERRTDAQCASSHRDVTCSVPQVRDALFRGRVRPTALSRQLGSLGTSHGRCGLPVCYRTDSDWHRGIGEFAPETACELHHRKDKTPKPILIEHPKLALTACAYPAGKDEGSVRCDCNGSGW